MVVVQTYHDRVRTDVMELVPADAGKVLDMGGGIGASSAYLKATGKADHAVLVDQVANTVADGIDKAYAGNIEDPALIDRVITENGPFDTILCLDILEHLRDPWTTVRQLKTGLRPGGVMIISVPNVSHYSVVGPLLLGKFELTDAGIKDRTHLRWFTRTSAIELAAQSGMKIDCVQNNIYSRRDQLINRLAFGVLGHLLSKQVVVRAIKA